ncbi:MAG: hypothetical protein JRH20_26445, partial [Deltaproteobacteria bacterium]|nr:hypothetical protein [Deltaproteobacteria bacterium]
FADEEVPAEARGGLLRRASTLPRLKRVLVESRPELITDEKLEAAHEALGKGAQLEVAIGLESADKTIREERINKGFTLGAFERACEKLAARGVGLVVYLLLKPMDTSEDEAIKDVWRCPRASPSSPPSWWTGRR